ncbi:uncharacterized protein LOC134222358 [Armigeres subalbatus]|uniref:uncharacterized protein LOC134222358 n=1 Tax=Armigeres subalbatus TaxID=124917 RepID=UPI002ED0840F
MSIRDSLLIIGDYNLPNIKWKPSKSNFFYPDATQSSISSTVARLIDGYNLARVSQLNFVHNNNGRMLDLCYGSIDGDVDFSLIEAPSPLVKSSIHHPALLVEVSGVSQCVFSDPVEAVYYDFKNGNYMDMNAFLSNVNWNEHIDQDLNSSVTRFSNIVLYAIDQFIPKRSSKSPPNPPWGNNYLKCLKRRKRAALRKYSKYKSHQCKLNYNSINARYKRLNKKLYIAHQRKVQVKLRHNPKGFWNYVNQQRKESGLPTVMTNGNIECSSTEDICNLFQQQFSNVFTDDSLELHQINEAANNVPVRPPVGNHPIVDADTVADICCTVKASTSCGPDGIPAYVLKNCSNSLSVPLASLFNVSLQVGTFPEQWKKSYLFGL